MKAFIIGVVVAIALAAIAGVGLKMTDRTSAQQYSTDNVRL